MVTNAEILLGFKADHSLINIQLTISMGCRSKGMWKFNTNILLNDPEFVNQTNEFIKEVIQNNGQLNPALKWEMLKCELVGHFLKRLLYKAKEHKRMIGGLYEKLTMLEMQIDMAEGIAKLQDKLQEGIIDTKISLKFNINIKLKV